MPNDHPVGARLLFWLGRACRAARTEASVTPAEVATLLGRNQQAVDNFELGKHTPRDLDTLLAIYGHLTGCDPRDLVRDALALWYEHGSAPRLSRADAEVGANPGVAVSPPPTLAPRSEKTSARRTRRAARQ